MTVPFVMAFLLLLSPVSAYAATSYGLSSTVDAAGIKYTGRASITTNTNGATATCSVTSSAPVLAGYIYTEARLYRGSSLVGSASGYNKLDYLNKGESSYYCKGWPASYSASGIMGGYDARYGGSYVYAPCGKTGSLYSSYAVMDPSSEIITEDAAQYMYVCNDEGETVGSAKGEEMFGVLPDWITAVGVNGIDGYVKAADFWTPMASNPADAVENFSIPRQRIIDVYESPDDSAGVIDSLVLNYGC